MRARLYLCNTAYVNNWDLVDSSAHKILGAWLVDKPRDVLYDLARSESLWERRISIISTFAFIHRGDLMDALALAGALVGDGHDLIHKASGWVLREVGKKDQPVMEARALQYDGAEKASLNGKVCVIKVYPQTQTLPPTLSLSRARAYSRVSLLIS